MPENRPVTDFWASSGHHLLDRVETGPGRPPRLAVTDEFLKAYLARPEILPPEEACDAERALWGRLRIAPRDPVTPADIAALADADARDNWTRFIGFRDRLLAHPTLEEAYVAIVEAGATDVPPLFLGQLTHLVLRAALDGETDPFVLRAAEMMFRTQRLAITDGRLILADEELVDGPDVRDHASPLVAMFAEARAADLDVMTAETAPHYFHRSDAHDYVLDFRPSGEGRAGLARAIERFVGHLRGVEVRVAPIERIDDDAFDWFVGLDAEATRIGNALWRGEVTGDDVRDGVVALFRLDFADPRAMLERVAGRPVYLLLGVGPGRIVRIKPQNLVTNLPLAPRPVAATA